MRIEEGFLQTPFPEEHPYTKDPVLPALFKRILPTSEAHQLHNELIRLGDAVLNDIRPLSGLVQPPTLTQYDHWGCRVDQLKTSEGWRSLTAFAIENSPVSDSFTREHGEFSRIFGFAKTMVATGDTHVVFCPISMTDGAARVLQVYGTDAMKRDILPRLISRNPNEAYLSGQWMTERPGGSDVSMTETTAVPAPSLPTDLGPPYLLSGFKFFSSAAEGNLAIALARTGDPSSGSRGLSAFLVPLRMPLYPTPLSNGIRMHRLKQKIGTHGLPTAELELNNTRGWMIGAPGQGVRTIAVMLNITRVYSAATSVGSLQRALSIARSYATVRTIAGGRQLLADNSLHTETLARVTTLYHALAQITFDAVRLLGRVECNVASRDEELRLRLLTPVVKAFASTKAISGMEECMAALGGQGYMEETGIGRLIRDALVERIWEGTVNVLAVDMFRAAKESGTVQAFIQWVTTTLDGANISNSGLQQVVPKIRSSIDLLPKVFASLGNPLAARSALMFVASLWCSVCLLEQAAWSATNAERSAFVDAEMLARWVEEGELEIARAEIERSIELGSGVGKRVALNGQIVFNTSAKCIKAKL